MFWYGFVLRFAAETLLPKIVTSKIKSLKMFWDWRHPSSHLNRMEVFLVFLCLSDWDLSEKTPRVDALNADGLS